MTTVFLKPASAGPDNINDSGVDTVIGSLTPFFYDAVGPTLNGGDSIQNVASLIVTDAYGAGFDIIPAGVFLANIGTVSLVTAGNAGAAGQPFDTSPFSGIGNLTVTSSGGGQLDYINAGPTTAIVEHQNSTGGSAGAIITGGSSVTVTSFGGNEVVIGSTFLDSNPEDGSVPLAGQTPTGPVLVTENGQGNVYEMGGTAVTVIANSTSYDGDIEIGNTASENTGDSAAGGFTNPTGPVVVADYGSNSGSSVTVFGGSSVFVAAAGDQVIVGDGGVEDDDNNYYPANAALNNTTGNIVVDDIAPVTWTNSAGMDNEVYVFGGNNVTVYTNTGGVTVGGTSENPGGTALQPGVNPTGNIVVTDTATAEDGSTGDWDASDNNDADINIYGGLNVSVAASGVDVNVGGISSDGFAAVSTGNVTITNFSTQVHDGIINDNNESTEVLASTSVAGSAVNIATNAGYVQVGTDSAVPGVNPTGNVTVTNLATYAFDPSVEVFGGNNDTVFTAAGTVIIGDGTGGFNPTGNVVVAEIGVNTGYHYDNFIDVGGGVIATVVTTGAGDGIVVGTDIAAGGSPVTGAVTIYDLYSGRQHDEISVLGGTTVSINDTVSTNTSINVGATPVLNVGGTALTNLADDPTGTVQIDASETFGSKTTFGTEDVSVVTNGSPVVYIQGGSSVFIQDAQSTLTGTSTPLGTSHLQTVILDGVSSTSDIIDDALANLTIANTKNTTVNVADDTKNSALTVTLGNATGVTLNTGAQGGFSGPAAVSSLAVNSVFGKSDINIDVPATLLGLSASAGSSLTLDNAFTFTTEKTILVNGAGSVFVGGVSGDGVLTLVNASGNSGGVLVEINPGHASFTGGSGNNTLFLSQNAFGAGVSLNGGVGGSNLVYAEYAASGTDVALGTIALSQFENFQSFGVVENASGIYSVQGFSNLVVGANIGGTVFGVAGPIDFTNVAQGTSIELIDTNSNTITYSLATPFSGTGGALSIQEGLDGVTTGNLDFLNLAGDNITSVTVNSQGKAGNELFIDGAPLTSVTITGDASLTLIDGTASSDVKTINASASSGAVVDVFNLIIDHGGVTVTGGSGEIEAQGYLGAGTLTVAPTSAKDAFNVGTGGGQLLLGAGGAGYNAGTGTNTGSETVNLTAGAAIGTTIQAIANVDASALLGPTTDGTYGIVNNWSFGTIASHQTADSLFLPSPVIIANTILGSPIVEAHGTYTVQDGVIASTGVVSFLNELSDAQAIVDAAPVGTVAEVTIFASQAAPQTATYIIENEGGGAKDIFVQLNGVTGVTGFGAVPFPDPATAGDIGAGTSVSINTANVGGLFANLTDSTNTGSATANHTFAEAGIINVIANAITGTGFSTTFNNLGNFGVVESGSAVGGNLVITQVGIDPVLTLTATSTVILDSFTYGNTAVANDDTLLVLDANSGPIVIGNVVDASNTGTTILIHGFGEVIVGGVTDTALTTIDASTLNAFLNLTANQNALTIVGATANGDTITANGTGDTISVGSASHLANTGADVSISAGGNGDHISVFGGDIVDIGAAGIGDVITVAGSASTDYITGNGRHFSSTSTPLATQLGAGDTINVGNYNGTTGNTADVHAWLGANSTVNLSVGSSVDLHLLGDTAGASGTNMTVINGVDANGDGVRLHFNDFNPGNNSTGITENWAGNGASWQSQVNVATAATLQQALNLAASQALVIDQQFGGGNTTVSGGALQLDSKTGLFDWFQFGGNTYLVEAVNSTSTAAAHAALLGANDIVVKLAGIVDANHIDVAHVVFSDIRLKRDIVEIARLGNGIGLYRYRYTWSDQVYVGVMAQEVAGIIPDAVVRGADGYFRVNYGRLGLKLMTWNQWVASNGERSREMAA